MPADTIALLRPKDPEKLKPYLDLDGEEETDFPYAEELEGGAFLVHTFQPFAVFQGDHDEGRVWLESLGVALSDAHDDPRGVLFFPDDHEPTATTYAEVVAEVEAHGIWIPLAALSKDEATARNARLAKDLAEAQRMVAELTGEPIEGEEAIATEIEELARRLQGSAAAAGGDPAFGAARMFEDVQKQLMGALGLPMVSGETLVVLLDHPPEAELDEADVADAYELPDGSIALHTFVAPSAAEELRAELGGVRRDWVKAHTDPRGVPTFSSVHLDGLGDVTSYAEVLERLGDEVTFLVP